MDTFNKVADMLSEQLGINKDKITLESDVIKDLGADSAEAHKPRICGKLKPDSILWHIKATVSAARFLPTCRTRLIGEK